MIEGIRNFSYESRLKLLKLHSLERRRVKEDLIEVFKWVKGFNKEYKGRTDSNRHTRPNEALFFFFFFIVGASRLIEAQMNLSCLLFGAGLQIFIVTPQMFRFS